MKNSKVRILALALAIIFPLIMLPSCVNNSSPDGSAAVQTQQDEEYLNEIYQKYVSMLNANSGITDYPWATPSDIAADQLVDFCSFNNLLKLKGPNGEYEGQIFFVPAEEVEAALLKYFDGISPEYLRTSRYYEFDEIPGRDYKNKYLMPQGGGGGLTKALKVEEDGDILRIVVGVYVGDDTENPVDTFLLSVRVEEDGFKYLSYETYT
ncbi:hypothetical protein SDC9_86355 [bioreactor metagenome]|uniref:Uncharacterized protein n=1 Tax=bioreactor metagenome TaxID=1076179 RepID=A0A644ZIR8_9ZZZZ